MSKLNRDVQLTPPVRERLDPGVPGRSPSDERLDTDMASLDMLGLHTSTADEARRLQEVGRKRVQDECYPVDDLGVQKYLAWLHLRKATEGDAGGVEFVGDYEVPETDTSDPAFSDWHAQMVSDGARMGVDSLDEWIDIGPLTFSVAMIGNLPTRICGSDALDAYELIVKDLGIDSLDSLLEDPDVSDESPLNFKWAVWTIFVMFILEFGLLFVLKSIAGVFSKWPLRIIYTFLRRLAINTFRKIRDYAFTKVFHVPGMENDDDESLRKMQIQKILLFANGNPLVGIGTKLGLC